MRVINLAKVLHSSDNGGTKNRSLPKRFVIVRLMFVLGGADGRCFSIEGKTGRMAASTRFR